LSEVVAVVVEVEVVEVLDWVVVGDAELPAKWICALLTVNYDTGHILIGKSIGSRAPQYYRSAAWACLGWV